MSNTVFPFFDDHALMALPSPKMTNADRVGVHAWFKEYAAFSESFASSVIESLIVTKNEIVFDPFLGSGTSLVAASKLNLPFIGVELSQFSVLLSRTKVSYKADPKVVLSLLEGWPNLPSRFSPILAGTFSESDLQYASSVISKICEMTDKYGKYLLLDLTNNNDAMWDSVRVALLSIVLSARYTSNLSKGSNPVWFRNTRTSEKEGTESLKYFAERFARTILADLKKYSSFIATQNIELYCCDARSIPINNACFDILLTSPPYLNRLDYVINKLPEILILSLIEDQDLDLLRKNMVGTTKIVEKGKPSTEWGPTCLGILDEIKNHSSRASNTYYIWNYYKYFKDIFTIFKQIKRLARPNARGILVVQNSHYKEIQIPVAKIFEEMSRGIGIEISEVKNISVKSHMGLLCPKQRAYTSNKTLNEAVLHLQF